ncbi:MAG: hypothetical protein HZB26_11105 [Candidatus Hydrogenedentes bacterium]|nr:hypothetical protein [Candidatus Hydrogenedentota bacterium]
MRRDGLAQDINPTGGGSTVVSHRKANYAMTVDEAHGPRNTTAVFRKGFFLIVIAALPVLLTSREPLLIAALGGMAAVLLAPFASTAFLLFLSLSLGLVTLLSEFVLPGPGFRLYGSDLVLYFLILSGFTLFLRRARVGRPVLEKRLLLLVGLMTAFGVVELGRGLLVQHFEMNDAAGDFRRLFIYPLAMVVPLLLPMGKRHSGMVKFAIMGGALLVIATGAYRLATGQSFHADYFTETEYDPRLLSSTETVTLEMALAYLTAMTVAGAGWMRRMSALVLGVVCAAFMVVSGWRLAAGFVVISPVMAVILMGRMRKRRLVGLVTLALSVVLVSVGGVVVLAMAAPETFARAFHQYQGRLNTFDIGHDARLWAWKQAVELWADQPILGIARNNRLAFLFAHAHIASRVPRRRRWPVRRLCEQCHYAFVGAVRERRHCLALCHDWISTCSIARYREP